MAPDISIIIAVVWIILMNIITMYPALNENGNEVVGNVDMQGKYGEGYIYDEEDNEIYIDAEWINNGELEATDQDGNNYELEVD
ncbi:MAG: hypothetical protein AB2L26_09065 [Ignavibacteria bacterium]